MEIRNSPKELKTITSMLVLVILIFLFCFRSVIRANADDITEGYCGGDTRKEGFFNCQINRFGQSSLTLYQDFCDIARNEIVNPKCSDNTLIDKSQYPGGAMLCFPCLKYGIECENDTQCGPGLKDDQNPLNCRDIRGTKRCVFEENSDYVRTSASLESSDFCVIGANECTVDTLSGLFVNIGNYYSYSPDSSSATCSTDPSISLTLGYMGKCTTGSTSQVDYSDDTGEYVSGIRESDGSLLTNFLCRVHLNRLDTDFTTCTYNSAPNEDKTIKYSMKFNFEVWEFDINSYTVNYSKSEMFFAGNGKDIIPGSDYIFRQYSTQQDFPITGLRYSDFINGKYFVSIDPIGGWLGDPAKQVIVFIYDKNNNKLYGANEFIRLFQDNDKRFDFYQKFEFSESDDKSPSNIELKVKLPYPNLGINYYAKIVVDGECPTTSQGLCEKTEKMSERDGYGYISIDSLKPVKESSSLDNNLFQNVLALDPVKYNMYLYFDCGNKKCTLPGYDQNFTKSKSTSGQYASYDQYLYAGASNVGILGCKGDLNCINCVMRKKGGTPFVSLEEAISSHEGTGAEFVYTNNVYTALGCFDTNYEGVVTRILQITLGISGFVIILRIAQALMKMMSADNPEAKKEGVEIITSALIALLVILFGAVGLRFIGINVFRTMSPGTIELESSE